LSPEDADTDGMPYYDEIGMSTPERDALILKLHRAGFSYRRIAKAVGMKSPGSVARALQRLSEGRPGRDPRP
jgi:hypothetical protein